MSAAAGCRFGDRCSLTTWNDVIECVGTHSEKTRSEIAARMSLATGKSESYFRGCLSQYDDAHNLQASLLPALVDASDSTAPIRWLAERCGYGIYRMPGAKGTKRDTLLATLDVFDAVNDAAREIRTAKADGQITRAEAEAFTLRARQAISELIEVIAAVNLEADPSEGGRR